MHHHLCTEYLGVASQQFYSHLVLLPEVYLEVGVALGMGVRRAGSHLHTEFLLGLQLEDFPLASTFFVRHRDSERKILNGENSLQNLDEF